MSTDTIADFEASRLRPAADIPAHVPPHLVLDLTKYQAPNTLDDPFSVTENIYQEMPPIFYSANRRAENDGSSRRQAAS